VIYMEHRDASGVFTEDRVEIIRLLAAQAMISLENAGLYQDQVRLTEAQSRFVPGQFLASLERPDIGNVELGEYVVKEMSVLFTDVRGFTTLSEQLHPKDVIVLLNRYFERMEPWIRTAGGFIDSFAGDGVMALFEVGPDHAVDAGIGMCHALDGFNEEWRPHGQPELRVGIGLNSGPLVLGTVGAHGRLQCTVIGDTVNAASRIEQLTKTYGSRFLIGQQSVERLSDRGRFSLRELDRVAVKGKTRAFDIYEVLDAEAPPSRSQKEATRALLAEVVRAYRARAFSEARDLASEGRVLSPADAIFGLYASRSEAFLARPPALQWAGVEEL
jgi:class 3 adenylate cyclase